MEIHVRRVDAKTRTLTSDGQPLIRKRVCVCMVFFLFSTATYTINIFCQGLHVEQKKIEKYQFCMAVKKKDIIPFLLRIFILLPFKIGQNLLFIYILF